MFGEAHVITCYLKAVLASLLFYQGCLTEAAPMQESLVTIHSHVRGSLDFRTLISMSNLAATYKELGKWDAAAQIFETVVKARDEQLGIEDEVTLGSYSNLAIIYIAQGEWDRAEPILIRVVETKK